MYEKNRSKIDQAMNFKLRPLLAAYIAKKLSRYFGGEIWWKEGVINVLYEYQRQNLPSRGSYSELTDKLDIPLCLLLIEIHWNSIFSEDLPRSYMNYVKELRTTRNLFAHEPESLDDTTTMRALDTMARISEPVDKELTEELRVMWRKKIPAEKPKVTEQTKIFSTPTNLKSWRDVIEPHPDVARGRYRQAEFAADLGQVVRGEGSSQSSPRSYRRHFGKSFAFNIMGRNSGSTFTFNGQSRTL